jgi:hypothetical protein
MRLPDKSDDELLKTIRIAVRSSGRERIGSYFRDKAKKQSGKPDDWFHNALYCWESMLMTDNAVEKHGYFRDAVDSCTKAIVLDNDYWPALFMRSLIYYMAFAEIGQQAIELILQDYKIADAERDLWHMIELQKAETSKSYFLVPYVGLAYIWLMAGKDCEAVSILNEGLSSLPKESISYLGCIMIIPYRLLVNKLLDKGLISPALLLGEHLQTAVNSKKVYEPQMGYVRG